MWLSSSCSRLTQFRLISASKREWPTFSLSSFTFIKMLFSPSLSAVRVVSSAYLRLLIFLPAILIPACASSSSAHKLNKHGDNIQPWQYTGIKPRSPALQVNSLLCKPPGKNGEILSKSQVVLVVKNPPTNAGDSRDMRWIGSLGREDPLEKEMATHSSIIAWEIPWTEKPGGLQSMGSERVGYDWVTNQHHSLVIYVCQRSAETLEFCLRDNFSNVIFH